MGSGESFDWGNDREEDVGGGKEGGIGGTELDTCIEGSFTGGFTMLKVGKMV